MTAPTPPGGGCFGTWFTFCVLLTIVVLLFVAWLAYLLVMHLTHGGVS